MFQISNVSKSQLLFFRICVATEFPLLLVHVSFLLLEDPFLLVRNSNPQYCVVQDLHCPYFKNSTSLVQKPHSSPLKLRQTRYLHLVGSNSHHLKAMWRENSVTSKCTSMTSLRMLRTADAKDRTC